MQTGVKLALKCPPAVLNLILIHEYVDLSPVSTVVICGPIGCLEVHQVGELLLSLSFNFVHSFCPLYVLAGAFTHICEQCPITQAIQLQAKNNCETNKQQTEGLSCIERSFTSQTIYHCLPK